MNLANQQKVCVIGAGIGGISAAVRLKEKGYAVTVYERSDRVGGKCYTRNIEFEGETVSFDMGAAVVAVSFRNLLRIARMLDEPTSKASPYKMVYGDGTIGSLRKQYWPKGSSLRMMAQFLKHARH